MAHRYEVLLSVPRDGGKKNDLIEERNLSPQFVFAHALEVTRAPCQKVPCLLIKSLNEVEEIKISLKTLHSRVPNNIEMKHSPACRGLSFRWFSMRLETRLIHPII